MPTTERENVQEKMVHLYTKLFDYELLTLTVDDLEIVELVSTSECLNTREFPKYRY